MWFEPGSRAAIFLFLQEDLDISPQEVGPLLNKRSGLTGRTNDLREIEAAAADGNECALLAIPTDKDIALAQETDAVLSG